MSIPPPLPHNIRIEVLFKTDDPRGKKILDEINALGSFSVERFEAEWFLFNMLARVSARQADSLREIQHKTAARDKRRAAKKAAK